MLNGGLSVSAAFDSGNIDVASIEGAALTLRLRPDPPCASDRGAAHSQWFHFRVANAAVGAPLAVTIENAGVASFPSAWKGYQVCASYDRETWFRVPTTDYDPAKGHLSWTLAPAARSLWFAYFPPYSAERHAALAGALQLLPGVTLSVLGRTLDGRDLDLLRVGEPGEEKRKVWFVARQHPGESMAEWFCEGLLRRLTDPHDPVARALLRSTTFYVVPNMNPDGEQRAGRLASWSLNSLWGQPSELCAMPSLLRPQSQLNGLHVSNLTPGICMPACLPACPRLGAGAPAHQRVRRQPQPRVGRALGGAQPRGAGGAGRCCGVVELHAWQGTEVHAQPRRGGR